MKKSFEPVRVKITGVHPAGYGTTDDPKLCVLGALAGEVVTAQPFTRRKRKIFARVLEVHEAAKDRIAPICSAADICGGCSLQHLAPAAQISQKQRRLADQLGVVQPKRYYSPLVSPVSNYRSKARLGVRLVEKKGKVLVGFREKMKPFISEISECCILRDPVSTLIPALADLVSSLKNPASIPQIEVAMGDSDTALVFRHLEPLQEADFDLFREFSRRHAIDIYLQPGNQQSVYKLFPEDKPDRLAYALPDYGLIYSFHPQDFTQINLMVNRKMVRFAVELLDLNSGDHILDAFCGIGNFSLAVASKVASVIGIEFSESIVARARENARKNHVGNCFFVYGDLFSECLELPCLAQINKVLLDPPRSGALQLCKILASSKVERVVYVSCNPETLARDTAILVDEGFQFEGAGVIDMFPHTTHIESIACFSR